MIEWFKRRMMSGGNKFHGKYFVWYKPDGHVISGPIHYVEVRNGRLNKVILQWAALFSTKTGDYKGLQTDRVFNFNGAVVRIGTRIYGCGAPEFCIEGYGLAVIHAHGFSASVPCEATDKGFDL